MGRPLKSGVQIRLVDLRYEAQTWDKDRRVVAKIEWDDGELFPRIGFIVTNSKLPVGNVVNVYNGRGDVENRIKEGKNTLSWDKTSCRRFAANQARLLMGVLAYNLLHMLRQFYLVGADVKRSMEWLIKHLIKVGAQVAYPARSWHVHIASGFPQTRGHGKLFRCSVVLNLVIKTRERNSVRTPQRGLRARNTQSFYANKTCLLKD